MDEKFVNLNSMNFDNVSIVEKEESNFLNDISKLDMEIKSNNDKNDPTLVADNYPYTLTLKMDDFVDDKEKKKFVNTVKRMVRGSYEYKLWTSYIRDVLQFNNCVLTNESGHELTIEIHHHPISLENIVKAVINKKVFDEITFCSFDIATEVIDLHFRMRVGFVPLITSLHEKFHNGFLDIPIELVKGDYKYIIDNYPLEDDVIELVKRYESIKLENFKLNWAIK